MFFFLSFSLSFLPPFFLSALLISSSWFSALSGECHYFYPTEYFTISGSSFKQFDNVDIVFWGSKFGKGSVGYCCYFCKLPRPHYSTVWIRELILSPVLLQGSIEWEAYEELSPCHRVFFFFFSFFHFSSPSSSSLFFRAELSSVSVTRWHLTFCVWAADTFVQTYGLKRRDRENSRNWKKTSLVYGHPKSFRHHLKLGRSLCIANLNSKWELTPFHRSLSFRMARERNSISIKKSNK